jgi:hypothetical protein
MFPYNPLTYFADPIGFAAALQMSPNCGHPPVTLLNARKDFHLLKLPDEDVPEEFHCCRSCALSYMTSFNIVRGMTVDAAAAKARRIAKKFLADLMIEVPRCKCRQCPSFKVGHLLMGNTCTLLTPGRSYNAAVAETRKRTEARNIDCAIVFTINSFSWDIHVAGGWATPNRLRKIGIQVKERVTTHGNLWDFFEPVRIRGGCGSRSIQLGAEGSKQLHALSPSRLNAA